MKTLIVIIFILFTVNINAQNETIHWYFGNKAGLSFDKGTLNVLKNSEMDAPATCASISNEDGLLMFYSNGKTVWNRNHEIMENGEDLAGDPDSFQSTIIIPKPGTNNIYFLFYSRLENGTDPLLTAGSFYSEIEFNNQFPLGKVTRKNAFLESNSPAEKITAVHHISGESFWLVTLSAANSDPEALKTIFKVYPITDEGINNHAVRTELDFGIEHYGSMKLSVDGSKLVVSSNTTNDRTRYVHVFNFNNENGEIEFVRNLLIDPPGGNWPPKGIEISPNGQFAYISFTAGDSNGIFQYQLDGPGANDDPRAILYMRSSVIIESLQLANDQKIYAALSFAEGEVEILGVINSPNEKGMLADYSTLSESLSPGTSKRGLPNFIQSYFASKIITENQCYVDEFTFSSTSYAAISDAFWDFGDGITGTGVSITHTYDAPGEYTVKGVLTVGSKKVTVYKIVEAYELPELLANQELVECDEDFDGLSTFNLRSIQSKITNPNLNEELFFYLSLDDLNNDIQILNPENFQNTLVNQEIYVKAINQNGCSQFTTFRVNSRFIQLDPIPNFYSCENTDNINGDGKAQFNTNELETFVRNEITIPNLTTLEFYPTLLDAQTNLNEFESDFISPSSSVFIKVQEQDGSCGGIQTFNLVVNSETKINIQDTYTICYEPSAKPPVIISPDSSNERYEWRNNLNEIISINQDFTLTTIGDFSLTVYKSENGLLCSTTKSFTVQNPEKPIFQYIDVNTEDSQNNIVQVILDGNSTYEFSLDNINFSGNATSYTFNNVVSGLRTIYVRDRNNCEESIQTKVTVIGFKKFFTPDGDGNNDYWNIKGINPDEFKSINILIFDRFGMPIREIKDFEDKGWDGTFNGKLLAPSSFWYKAKIIDIDNNLIEESGNFSLIRL